MRVNLTKKDLVNLVYMQIGFSKQISENLIEEFFFNYFKFKKRKKNKNFKIWNFSDKRKKIKELGRNPKTKEGKIISSRKVVLFKPSKEFKEFINIKNKWIKKIMLIKQ